MTRYEKLQSKKLAALEQAKAHITDLDLYRFFMNAAEGYQQKADALTAAEAAE